MRSAVGEGSNTVPPRWTDEVQLDDRWRALIDKAMAQSPTDRFADIKSLAAAMSAITEESGTVPKASRTA